LNYIQEFEPTGIAAESLTACIVKQLKDNGVFDEDIELIKEILDNYHHLLEVNNLEGIAAALGISTEYVYDLIEMIKRTDPKPGLTFSSQIQYVVPDVYVVKKGDELEVIPNDESIPSLKLNGYYIKMLKNKDIDKNTYEYISEKVKNALMGVKESESEEIYYCLCDGSNYTISKRFLFNGFEALKPLKLRDIAEDIGIHESTISRVTSGKYAMTEFGVLEIKTFFCQRTSDRFWQCYH